MLFIYFIEKNEYGCNMGKECKPKKDSEGCALECPVYCKASEVREGHVACLTFLFRPSVPKAKTFLT